MIDEGTPTQAAEKNRGAIFDYTRTKIAPDFIKKFGVNFVTEFKDYFGVQKKCHGGKKGGGKIDLAKLDKDSYVFLKKYEIILEYVLNVKYLEHKKIESIESFESKLSLPTVQDKLSTIPEVDTYKEKTSEEIVVNDLARKKTTSPYQPNKRLKTYVTNLGNKRTTMPYNLEAELKAEEKEGFNQPSKRFKGGKHTNKTKKKKLKKKKTKKKSFF